MAQSRSAYLGLGVFGLMLSMAIACGNDSAPPPGSDSDDDSSSSDGGSGGGSDGSGGDTNSDSGGTGGDDSSASTSTDAAGGTGSSVPVDTGLGDQCATDDDCETDWTCIPADEPSYQIDADGTLASVPNGICTKECADANDCWEDDEWSVCLGFTEEVGYCMPFCVPGDDIVECGARPDMVCSLIPTGDDGAACADSAECASNQICVGDCLGVFPVCVPNCATDENCPSDRFCDPATGACVENEPSGAAVGEGCEDDEDCASLWCAEGVCSRTCTFGVDDACGTDGACFPAFDVTTDPGDLGRCWSLCDCPDDCGNDTCLSWQDDDFAAFIGYAGFCGEALTGDVELTCD